MAMVGSENRVPYEVQVALIDAVGKVFWYWDDFRRYLRKAGVSEAGVKRHTNPQTNKYAAMRALIDALDRAEKGPIVQRKLVQNLAGLELQPQEGLDFKEAKSAQARLRTVADGHDLLPELVSARRRAEADASARERREQASRRAAERERQAAKREALRREFTQLLSARTEDRQARGYRLEEIIGELAALEGLRYAAPYRKGTATQTDGMITFEAFQYLIEARWRTAPSNVAQVDALGAKARRALHSTRGLFISIEGFRPEVVRELETGDKNVLLMTGQELAAIFEGRITLCKALQLKVEEAAKRGNIFFDVSDGSG